MSPASGSPTPDGPDPASVSDAARLARVLTTLRERRGLTVRQVARTIGEPPSTVGGWFSGRHLPPVTRLEVVHALLSALEVPPEDQAGWVDALHRVSRKRRGPEASESPFRGLRSFEPEDAGVFFGREDLVDDLVRMAEHIAGERDLWAVAVVGPSGAGKSSVVRAGLIPTLMDRQPGRWQAVTMTPGEDPAEALQRALRDLRPRHPQILVVDQFEELWTLVRDDRSRAAFVAALREWGTAPGTARAVVLNVRADHYGQVSGDPLLLPVLRHHQALVGPMTSDQLSSAITGPAQVRGLGIEEGLVDVLVAACGNQGSPGGATGSLPHLSHTLAAMWEHSDRRELTLADYRAVGGIEGAIAQTAEEAFAALGEEGRRLARPLLLRMVTVDDTGAVSRRRLSREEVRSIGGQGGAEQVLDHLVGARLVQVDEDHAQLSHEALLWAWPRLAGWINESRANLPLQERLSREAAEWIASDRDDSHLLRGSRLAVAREWATTHPLDLTGDERTFVDASTDHEAAETRRRAAQERTARRLLVAVSIVSVVGLVLAGVTAVAWRSAAQERADALSRQLAIVSRTLRDGRLPVAEQLAAAAYRTSPTLEARSALLDATSSPTVTRRVTPGGVRSLASSPDGSLIAVGREKGGIDLVRIQGRTMTTLATIPLPDHTGGAPALTVQKVEFSPDGQVLAAIGNETLQLVDLRDATHPRVTHVQVPGASTMLDLAFSPDGTRLFIATAEVGIARFVLDGASVSRELPPDTALGGILRTVQVSPDGHVLVAANGSGDITTFSVDGSVLRPVDHVAGDGRSALFTSAFSPDGSVVAIGGKDRRVRLFDIDDGGHLGHVDIIGGFSTWVNEVAFSPDGRTLATASSDNTIKVWHRDGSLQESVTLSAAVATVAPAVGGRWVAGTVNAMTYLVSPTGPVLSPVGDSVFAIRYDRSGDRMVTAPGTGDGAVHIWDTTSAMAPVQVATVRAPADAGILDGCAALTPDGRLLASGTATGSVLVWNIADPRSPRLLVDMKVSGQLIEQLAFSRDTSKVVVGGDDGHVRVIDVSDPAHPHVVSDHDAGAPVMDVAAGPGSMVVTSDINGAVEIWTDPGPGAVPAATVRAGSTVTGLDIDGSGTRLAAGSADTTLYLWDISDPGHPRAIGSPLNGPGNQVFAVAFSPDASMVAGAVEDDTVWLWRRRSDGTYTRYAVLHASDTPLLSVAWSPDGSAVVAGGHQGETRMWLVSPTAARSRVCGMVGDRVTPEEWRAVAPGVPYVDACA